MKALLLGITAIASATASPSAANDVLSVAVSDGVTIAVECTGAGDTLLIVHGGTGDRTRWTPMFPLLERDFRVCAMDRRGHGESGDAERYSIEREAQDVEEVAAALPGPVSVLGHSFGGVTSLEAALRTPLIKKLILYEPPLQDGDHTAIAAEMERLLAAGDQEAAAEVFFTRIVRVSAPALERMKSGPNWPRLVASMRTVLRMDRALGAHKWNPERFRKLETPTLLLLGQHTPSLQIRKAMEGLQDALPDRRLVMLEGQDHNAMDNGRDVLARAIIDFLKM